MDRMILQIITAFFLRFFWNTIILLKGSEDGIYLHLYPWQEQKLEQFLQDTENFSKKVLDKDGVIR